MHAEALGLCAVPEPFFSLDYSVWRGTNGKVYFRCNVVRLRFRNGPESSRHLVGARASDCGQGDREKYVLLIFVQRARIPCLGLVEFAIHYPANHWAGLLAVDNTKSSKSGQVLRHQSVLHLSG
ncbi:hypothetical protein NADFUDRAFT_41801 [Nadsonia fulvescens var. elongata DSM 6958]|uniref:Uncharacterized protein n=1 Tax=Nadsonia fulvescens var. elongata DSM 6958 TaxID=857566 RepID=A0A1E3PLJ0_9ASCO|nr:hypothetical protein NADFUDRAFT_41801 [Nadsonia fulvescens var. elongata DSM 6958]